MNSSSAPFRGDLHSLLLKRSFYPLAAFTALAMGMLSWRVQHTQSYAFLFYSWNLFLAWLPYLFSLALSFDHRRGNAPLWRTASLGLLWLLFFPNAPYLVTDLIHLRGHSPQWWEFDLGLSLLCAGIGLYLAFASLYAVHEILKQKCGTWIGWGAILVIAGLNGVGVYLGRVLRWNSWDMLTRPHQVLADVWVPLSSPLDHLHSIRVVLSVGVSFLLGYLAFFVYHRQSEPD